MAGHAGRFLGVFLGMARAFQRRGDRAPVASNLPAADGAAATHKERRCERARSVPVDPIVPRTSFVTPATPVTRAITRRNKKNTDPVIIKISIQRSPFNTPAMLLQVQ